MTQFTNFPREPSNTSISYSSSWDNSIKYNNITYGYYNYSGGSYTSYSIKILNSVSVGNSGSFSSQLINNITDLKIHKYATELPSTSNSWDITFTLTIGSTSNISKTEYTTAHSSDISRNISDNTDYTQATDTLNRITYTSQIYDKYTSPDDLIYGANKYWMAMDISNITIHLNNLQRLQSASVNLNITNNSNYTSGSTLTYNITETFNIDNLNSNPSISNKSSSLLNPTTDVEWNCGIANLKNGNEILFTFNINNLASGSDGFFPFTNSSNEKKLFDITSSHSNTILIEHDDSTYGVQADSDNNGNSISYINKNLGITFNPGSNSFIDNTNIGTTFNFTISCYNIKGVTTETITSPRILRDYASLNNTTMRNIRYRNVSGTNSPTSQTSFSGFDTQALPSDELLLWNGYYSGYYSDYKDFTQSTYNIGATSSLSNLSGTYNVGTFRYGLFRFGGLAPNTSEITVVFTTPPSENYFNSTDTTGTSPQSDFSLELYLATSSNPSGIWCDGNQPTDLNDAIPKMYTSRTKSGNTTTINLTPPGYSSHLSNLWLRVGLKSKSSNPLKFTNISITSSQ